MLFAALIAACAIAPEAAKATELEQTVCRNGTREAVCSVTLDDNSLELKLESDLMLQARRLGRWRMSHQDGITTRSCNARIDLGSEVLYGVLRISSSTGTSLIWPQQKLEIPDLHFSSTHSMPRESHLETPLAQPGHP